VAGILIRLCFVTLRHQKKKQKQVGAGGERGANIILKFCAQPFHYPYMGCLALLRTSTSSKNNKKEKKKIWGREVKYAHL
jgi:hypothetical protein